jgi:enoyl-[acyl-carrier-protein] reductase (NADH)
MQVGSLLAGKRGLVMGVANDKSIAWGIAEAAANPDGRIWKTPSPIGKFDWIKHHDRM